MKKLNFKWLAVLCMAMGFVTVAKAQIYNSDVLFFLSTSGESVAVCKFEGTNAKTMGYGVPSSNINYIKNALSEDPNTFSKTSKEGGREYWKGSAVSIYKYNAELSTSDKEVYQTSTGYPYTTDYIYIAISKDLKTLITWWQSVKGGEPRSVVHYINVQKEDLLPKNIIPDFLND